MQHSIILVFEVLFSNLASQDRWLRNAILNLKFSLYFMLKSWTYSNFYVLTLIKLLREMLSFMSWWLFFSMHAMCWSKSHACVPFLEIFLIFHKANAKTKQKKKANKMAGDLEYLSISQPTSCLYFMWVIVHNREVTNFESEA